jgi:two-component system, LytTR family, response regulator
MPSDIKTIIVDDEPLARGVIRKFLASFPEVEIVAECSNGFEAVKKITELKPDLIFLDIQMPKITGFEMLELIENPPVIIFTTAFDHFALKAFEVNAADYLLKPFSRERFTEAINKAKKHLTGRHEQQQTISNIIMHNEDSKEFLERVVIKEGSKINIIPVDQIKYIEAQDDYVLICSQSGKFLKQKTMKYFEEHLDPADYIRIHRSFIVAVGEIQRIELLEKESYIVILKENVKLPVSKSGYEKLKEVLK